LGKNYYEILGVNKDATPDGIKKAFRQLSKEHHPDIGGDEDKFKELNEAYSVLSNPEKRMAYDNPANNIGFNPFGDMFRMRRPDPNAPRRGQPVGIDQDVPLRYFIFGGNFKANYSIRERCTSCSGTGAEEKQTCPKCNGSGQVMTTQNNQGMTITSSRPCPDCLGAGFTVIKKCSTCDGVRSVLVEKNVDLDLPANMPIGFLAKIPGAGAAGINGGPPGDLHIRFFIQLPKAEDLTEEQAKVLKEI
jgi:molecular chaperone DnaJ